jgi:hypothetical protein
MKNLLVDAFLRFGNRYLRLYGESMLPSHRKAFLNFTQCRTETYGKLISACPQCGQCEESSGACRNRACPKCNNSCTQSWIKRQKERFPRIPYHHLVFTVPSELRYLARQNQSVFYEKLMEAVANTLTAFGQSPRWVNGRIGFLSVLHTWDSKLNFHPHVHVLLLGGYLGDDGHFVEVKRKVMFPHSAMQVRYKTVFLNSLKKALNERVPNFFWKLPWVIYSKKTFPGTHNVLDYLGRYIKRIGIAPSRILKVDKHGVEFKYRHRIGKGKSEFKKMRLDGEEFLRRYLQHILPKGFIRVRYYGLLHPYFKEELEGVKKEVEGEKEAEVMEKEDKKRCSDCRLPMMTSFLILPAFIKRGKKRKKGSEFYINSVSVEPQKRNDEKTAYNQLIEPTAPFPARGSLSSVAYVPGEPRAGRGVSTPLNGLRLISTFYRL